MVQRSDWLPAPRAAQIGMAKKWIAVVTAKGKEWSVPNKTLEELERLTADAETVLAEALDESTRTPVVNSKCRRVFAALVKFMRDMKRKYFILGGEITADDFTALGLKIPDSTSTPVPPPSGQAAADITFHGPHLLMLHVKPLTDTLADAKADYGVRIYRGILPPGGATVDEATGPRRYLIKAPVSGEDLPHSVFTRRKKELFDFPAEDSGKTVYFCIRYENSKGEAGPWGPVFFAVIP